MSSPQQSLASSEKASRIRVLALRLLWVLGWGAALVSVGAGVRNSWRHSQDFQWSSAALVVHHIDPWKEFLAGNPAGRIILYQFPNYLHLLYFMLAPFGFMSFANARVLWAAANLVFTGVALWSVKELFAQSPVEWGVTCILFLCSTPFRNSLGNGQQTLLIVALVALAYRANAAWQRSLWAGLSYFKYSFSVPLMFDLLFRGGLLIAALSLVPALIGLLWVYWMVGGSWLRVALEPLLVSRTAIEGVGDLMSAVDLLVPHRAAHPILYATLEYALPLFLAGGLVWFAHTRRQERRHSRFMAAVCAVSALGLFKHAFYDYAMLLFPFAYGVRYRLRWAGRSILLGVLYLWFATRILWSVQQSYSVAMMLCNLSVLTAITVLILRIGASAQAQSLVIPSADTVDAKRGAAGAA